MRPQDQGFLVAVGRQARLITNLTHSVEQLRAGLVGLDPRQFFLSAGTRQDEFGGACVDSPPDVIHLHGGLNLPDHWWCGTLLWNGIYSSADLVAKIQTGRKALLVLTDGVDEGSTRTLAEAIEAAQAADVIVYALRHPYAVHTFRPFRFPLPVRRASKATQTATMGKAELMGLTRADRWPGV